MVNGEYEGEVNADGKAFGEGVWKYGDFYIVKGTWKNNFRHGLSM